MLRRAGEALARDAYENAEPLLGDLTVGNYDRLVEAMRVWTGIPGLFDGEETYQTVVARQMIQMTQSINETWGDHVAPAGVTCYTCHRGEPVPIEHLVRHLARWWSPSRAGRATRTG